MSGSSDVETEYDPEPSSILLCRKTPKYLSLMQGADTILSQLAVCLFSISFNEL